MIHVRRRVQEGARGGASCWQHQNLARAGGPVIDLVLYIIDETKNNGIEENIIHVRVRGRE